MSRVIAIRDHHQSIDPINTLVLIAALLYPCATCLADEPLTFLPLPFGSAPIDYWGESDDAVSRLQQRLASGDVVLRSDERFGLLPALLTALKIDPASQVLKFASGAPHREIGPMKPRAIYFRDDLSVAWYPGAPQIEIAVQSPRTGTVFYTLTATENVPRFERPQRCLACHTGPNTGTHVPGWQLQSGVSLEDAGSSPWRNLVSPALPFDRRWQAWYVSGDVVFTSGRTLHAELPFLKERDYFMPTSDPAVLLIRDHWLLGMNLLTRWSYEHQLRQPREETTAALVRHLLMLDEVPLPKPLPRDTAFVRSWHGNEKQAPSLRELDLQTRTFRYAVSPLLLTAMVQYQPFAMRRELFRRVDAEMQRHREPRRLAETTTILRATVPDWP